MEHIIFFIDIDSMMDEVVIGKQTRLDLVKKGLTIFLHSKDQMTNQRHKYGIAALTEEAILISEFTDDNEKIVTTVNNLQPVTKFSKFDMNSVFEVISGHFKIPKKREDGSYKYTLRAIFVYSRPYVPVWGKKNQLVSGIKNLISKPYFYFDAVYFHNRIGGSRGDGLYSFLIDLTTPFDFSKKCYNFKVPDLPDSEVIETTFYESFALLTANPFCRRDQNHQISFLKDFMKK